MNLSSHFSSLITNVISERKTKAKQVQISKDFVETTEHTPVESHQQMDPSSTEAPKTSTAAVEKTVPAMKGKLKEVLPGKAFIETSVPKDDISLFPEIGSSIPITKATGQPEMVIEKTIPSQTQTTDIPVEQTPSRQIHQAEVLCLITFKLVFIISFLKGFKPKYVYIFLSTGI